MSTRYIKRDNVRILGLAKNASQALKQVSIHNNNWELHNENPDEYGLTKPALNPSNKFGSSINNGPMVTKKKMAKPTPIIIRLLWKIVFMVMIFLF